MRLLLLLSLLCVACVNGVQDEDDVVPGPNDLHAMSPSDLRATPPIDLGHGGDLGPSCEQPSDCSSGQVCCITPTSGPTNYCLTANDCATLGGLQACQQASDCTAQTCCNVGPSHCCDI